MMLTTIKCFIRNTSPKKSQEFFPLRFDEGISDLMALAAAHPAQEAVRCLLRRARSDMLFEAYDLDDSGELGYREFSLLMRKFDKTHVDEPSTKRIFEACGGVGCSHLTKDDFEKWVSMLLGDMEDEEFEHVLNILLVQVGKQAEAAKAHCDSLFEAFDFDSSGLLDLDELTVLMGGISKRTISKETVTATFEICGGEGCIALTRDHFERWILLMLGEMSDDNYQAGVDDLLVLAKTFMEDKLKADQALKELEMLTKQREEDDAYLREQEELFHEQAQQASARTQERTKQRTQELQAKAHWDRNAASAQQREAYETMLKQREGPKLESVGITMR